MIDTENLRTASLYINNQLLSRGLLRDGQTIDFVGSEEDGVDTAATMGRIMSVVNDLILRRDRDAEHRESLSTTMRVLKAENTKYTADLTKLHEKRAETERKLHQAESAETSLKTQLKSAEIAARGLKEEMARTKILIAQARASCATEVRRRDRQIDTMKKQLSEAGRARGSRGSPGITLINLTPDVRQDKKLGASGGASTTDESYSLQSETNEFLAKLAQNLSEENENLLKMMQHTMHQLKEMSGWTDQEDREPEVIKQPGLEDLSSDLDSVLDHMKTILTNPSFVPIEEVVVREEEIVRLKEGWFKMESRWKEAVHLIDGWRKRMAANGKPIDQEELKLGLSLSPVRVKGVEETRGNIIGISLAAVAEEEEEEEQKEEEGDGEMEMVKVEEDPEEVGGPAYDSGTEARGADIDMIAPKEHEEYESERDNYNHEILEEEHPTHTKADPVSQSIPDSGSSSPLPEPPQLSPLKAFPTTRKRKSDSEGRLLQRRRDLPRTLKERTEEAPATSVTNKSEIPRGNIPSQRGLPRSQPGKTKSLERPSATLKKQASNAQIASEKPDLGSESLVRTEEEQEEEQEEQEKEEPQPPPAVDCVIKEDASVGNSRRSSVRRSLRLSGAAESVDANPQQSPLTMSSIAAKLAASEREADAARVRAKLKAARGTGGVQKPTLGPSRSQQPQPQPRAQPEVAAKSSRRSRTWEDQEEELDDQENNENVDPVKRDPRPAEGDLLKPVKRQRVGNKVSSRRRSSRSPWELESLMTGKAT